MKRLTCLLPAVSAFFAPIEGGSAEPPVRAWK